MTDPKTKKTITVEIPVSPVELAGLWWSMDGDQQAEFFNALGEERKLPFQLQEVTDCKTLSFRGRMAMSLIGEYGPIKK